MQFTKMHGLGNDYIYLYCQDGAPQGAKALAQALSDRHTGIGADGLIVISPSESADFCMSMWNADGSEGKMCGNGIRCVGKYVYEHGLTDKDHLIIETASGPRELWLDAFNGVVRIVTVDMDVVGIDFPLMVHIGEDDYCVTPVDTGNPHAVLIVESVETAPVEQVGSALQESEFFPDGVNVSFLEIVDEMHAKLRVYERGSGQTQACGSGACAAFAAAHRWGVLDERAEIEQPGGVLNLESRHDDGHVLLSGGATTVFEGEIELSDFSET